MRITTLPTVLSILFFVAGCFAIASRTDAQELKIKGVDSQRAAEIKQRVEKEYPALEKLYKHFHANPELSLQEKETSARLAKELRASGFEVTERVGGYGVVAVLKNGQGPTIMVRADMDALPIVEETGLPYASKTFAKDKYGRQVGVMHACGHDANITSLVGTARVLAGMKDQWSGTLVLIGQPAEEIGEGAKAMIEAGLFRRFPRPDRCFALHCDSRYPVGHVNYRVGQMQSNVDSVDIIVKGKGGHGAAPHKTVDPIVLASHIVIKLQSIVSREVNPLDPAVVTVGAFHAGTKHNIIPDEVKMLLTVRTTKDEVREKVLAAIGRIARGEAEAAGAPQPEIIVDPNYTPSLFNDVELGNKTVALLEDLLGKDKVHERPFSLGGEDFAQYIRAGVPGFYFFVGSAQAELVKQARSGGKKLAGTHTSKYYPIPEPTIKTGVFSMSAAVLNVLGK